MLSPNGGIRLQLDLAIGETSEIESTDKTKMEDLVGRVRDLNSRLQDIRREQVFQRVRFSYLSPPPSSHSSFFIPFSQALRILLAYFLANTKKNTGEGSRVPRPVRNYQLPRRAVDGHPAHRPRCHLRMAVIPPAVLLHQGKTYVAE